MVSALLRDLRDLFYLVDGSNLRPRLRPHASLGTRGPTQPTDERCGNKKCKKTRLCEGKVSPGSKHFCCESIVAADRSLVPR